MEVHGVSLLLLALACAPHLEPAPPALAGDSDRPADPPTWESDSDLPPDDTGGPGERVAGLSPVVWLRADDLALPRGAEVGRWDGATPGSAGAWQDWREWRPRLRPDEHGGHAVVRFDGRDDRLNLDVQPFDADGFTVLAVAAVRGRDGLLVGTGPTWAVGSRDVGAGLVLQEGAPVLRASSGDGGMWVRGATNLDDGRLHLVSGVASASQSALFVDGRVAGTSLVGLRPEALAYAALGAGAGSALDANRDALAADVAEVLVFDRPLGTCERQLVEGWLAARYGLEVARERLLPSLWHRADSAPAGAVSSWPSELQGAGPAAVEQEDRRPFGGAGVTFDGVDDRLVLPFNPWSLRPVVDLTTVVTFATTDDEGHLVGTGSSVPDALLTFGTGLVIVDGVVAWKNAGGGAGDLVLRHPRAVADGRSHVVVATRRPDGVVLAVDGEEVRAEGGADPFGFAVATLGASDGSGAGAAEDALAVSLGEVRAYRRALDDCDLDDLVPQLVPAPEVAR